MIDNKPPDCTCGYPQVIVRNMCGHPTTCEYYARWKRELNAKTKSKPATQPHYGGWALYDDLMAKIELLPNTNTAIEHNRGDVIKRMGRLGNKDSPRLEIDKAIAQVEKLMLYYPDGIELLPNPFDPGEILGIIRSTPAGFGSTRKERLRLEVILGMVIGEFTPDVISTLEKLKREYAD